MKNKHTDNMQSVKRLFGSWRGRVREFLKGRFCLEDGKVKPYIES